MLIKTFYKKIISDEWLLWAKIIRSRDPNNSGEATYDLIMNYFRNYIMDNIDMSIGNQIRN